MPYIYKFIFDVPNNADPETKDVKTKIEAEEGLRGCKSSFDCYSRLINFFLKYWEKDYSNPNFKSITSASKTEEKLIKFEFDEIYIKNIASEKKKAAIKLFFDALGTKTVADSVNGLEFYRNIYKNPYPDFVSLNDDLKKIKDEYILKGYDDLNLNIEVLLNKLILPNPFPAEKKQYLDIIVTHLSRLSEAKNYPLPEIVGEIIDDLLSKVNDLMGKIVINCYWNDETREPILFKPHIIANILDYIENVGLNQDENTCKTNMCTIDIPLIARYTPNDNWGYKCPKCNEWEKCSTMQSSCIKFYNCFKKLYANPIKSEEFAKFVEGKEEYKININEIQQNVVYNGKNIKQYRSKLLMGFQTLTGSTYYKKLIDFGVPKINATDIDGISLGSFFKLLILIDPMGDLFKILINLPNTKDDPSPLIWKPNPINWLSDNNFQIYVNIEDIEKMESSRDRINRIKSTISSPHLSFIYALSEKEISNDFIFEKVFGEGGHGIGRADEIDDDLFRWKFEGNIDSLKKRFKDEEKKNKLDDKKLMDFIINLNPKTDTRIPDTVMEDEKHLIKININHKDIYFVRCNTPYVMKIRDPNKSRDPNKQDPNPLSADANERLRQIQIAYYRKVGDFSVPAVPAVTKVLKKIKDSKEKPAKNKPNGKNLGSVYHDNNQMGLNLPYSLDLLKNNSFKKVRVEGPLGGLKERPRQKAKFFRLDANKKIRLEAGQVMKVIAQKFGMQQTSSLSATTFADTMIAKDKAQKDWKILKDTKLNNLPTDQEWCHLQGHGDNGPEIPANFVSGSNHCNTEQLAIELGHRPTTHPAGNYYLKSTAYLFDYSAPQTSETGDSKKRSRPELSESPEESLKKRQKTEEGKSEGEYVYDERIPPLVAFIRYKIFKEENDGGNKKKVKYFDYSFEGQSEFFDKNQYNIINKTVEYVFNPDGFIEKLGNFLDEGGK